MRNMYSVPGGTNIRFSIKESESAYYRTLIDGDPYLAFSALVLLISLISSNPTQVPTTSLCGLFSES